MANSFGTNVSVCSCMDVIVWNRLTMSPTIIDTSKTGSAVSKMTHMVCLVIVNTACSVILISIPQTLAVEELTRNLRMQFLV
jgi:hypothetical protein